MSVLNLMKKGHQQAKQHAAEESEKSKQEVVKAPYKHVPTHAAIDALSGANWQEDYRQRIKEQNQKRQSMLLALPEPKRGTMPRVSSSLSTVSYPTDRPSPFRVNSSQSTRTVDWKGKGRDIPPHNLAVPSVHRIRSGDSPKKVTYRSGGSDNSSSSEDELEVHHVRTTSLNAGTPGGSRSGYTPPRNHYFTAPRPMDNKVLSTQAALPSFPAPPGTMESTTSSPAMSNYVSYASSARSAASSFTAPSSKASTPAASINDETKRPSSALEIRATPKKAKKNRWSFMLSRRSTAVAV
ncbi:hypothetical protein PFICI_04551 [Pestalotiopsis fici W106-1]|uniref:Uncharacterized protein n=1 Tax=Pestalotiopsis fici (strain W106-1 / CGMCC3.15140) TaxID=1229662 RepID=W3X9D9_PESFW|nr:uncharacterized protein PFICI_04551 [Pestalotiopsis fici W106-1]ETS82675.1 hypothetical protein PFICI_04551 [Pestalotiopsis fici W106-1]